MTTLEKVRRLEQYVAADPIRSDPVLDTAISKLIDRETTRITELRSRLIEQCLQFEQTYSLSSKEFYTRYECGELGDEMDYIEWAATVEMIEDLHKRLKLLQVE